MEGRHWREIHRELWRGRCSPSSCWASVREGDKCHRKKDEKRTGRGDFKVTDKAGVTQLLKSQGRHTENKPRELEEYNCLFIV